MELLFQQRLEFATLSARKAGVPNTLCCASLANTMPLNDLNICASPLHNCAQRMRAFTLNCRKMN